MPPPIQLPSSNDNSLFFQKLVNTKLDTASTPTDIKKQERIAREKLKSDEKWLAIQEKTLKILEKAVFKIQGTSNYKDLNAELDKDNNNLNRISVRVTTLKKTLGDWNPLTITFTGIKEKQALNKWNVATTQLAASRDSVMNFFDNATKAISGKTTTLFKGMVDVGSCIGRFLTGAFKITWKIVDKLMYFGFGTAWTWTKKVISSVASVGKWLLNTGWEAISLVGTGLKVMFNFGVDLIKKTSSYILGGAAKFFGWYFKNLFTTLFSPSMWIINIPIFVGISFVIFRALEGIFEVASGPIYNAISATFSTMFTSTKDLGKWLWNGVQAGFDWLINVHIGDKTIKEYYTEFKDGLINLIGPWVGSGSTFGKVISWVSETYIWLKTKFNTWYTRSANVFKSVVSYIKEMPGRTLVGKFINKLKTFKIGFEYKGETIGITAASVVPYLSDGINAISQRYGFAMNGQSDDLENALETQKTSVLQSALERQIVAMTESGKTHEQIDYIIKNHVLPKLRGNMFGDVKKTSEDSALSDAYANSENIIKGKTGLISDEELTRKTDNISKIVEQIGRIDSGQFDFSKETEKEIADTFLTIDMLKNKDALDRAASSNKGMRFDKLFADATIDKLDDISTIIQSQQLVQTWTQLQNSDPENTMTPSERASITLAKISTNIGHFTTSAIYSFGKFIPGGFLLKSTLGLGTAFTGALGQDTLNAVADQYSRGSLGNGIDTSTNTPMQGSITFKGPDKATSLVEEYFKEFKGVPNITAIKTQAKNDVIDLLDSPYIADENQRKQLVRKYLDNDKYDKLWRSTSHKEFGDGVLTERIQIAMGNLFAKTASLNVKKMATGGIMAKDMNKIIPLDEVGQEYIRDQIMEFSKNKDDKIDINKKKDQKTLTNIINETVYESDNYEMYALKQLTKGTLGTS